MEQANGRTQDWLAKGKVKPEWVDAGELGTGDYVAQVIPKEVVRSPGSTTTPASKAFCWAMAPVPRTGWSGESPATRNRTAISTS